MKPMNVCNKRYRSRIYINLFCLEVQGVNSCSALKTRYSKM